MTKHNEIRADFDANIIVIYQAYASAIAAPALKANRFVPPFSFNRMTWIKPSFLWLMERSNWGQKSGQEFILAVRIKRDSWDKALSLGVLTSYESTVYGDYQKWSTQFEKALVHVQWDPERSIRGADLGHNSIQVGISRHLIQEYVEDWIIEIKDYTPLVKKIHALLKSGQADKAKKLLPNEKLCPVSAVAARQLMIQD